MGSKRVGSPVSPSTSDETVESFTPGYPPHPSERDDIATKKQRVDDNGHDDLASPISGTNCHEMPSAGTEGNECVPTGADEVSEQQDDAVSDGGAPPSDSESEESRPAVNTYVSMIQEKIEAGELDKGIVDSLELQRLVDGCAVPLGQEVVEDAVVGLDEARRTHLEDLMSRPARRQIEAFEGNAYIQGSEEYNIWYNKWSGERANTVNGRAALMPAMYKCDPERDTGYTRGSGKNTLDDCGTKFCCLFFAKGCCTQGSKCNYLHRVPTVEDEFFLDTSVDIFGRERHAKHRDDMSGVGSFMSDCKSLFIGDVYPDNAEYNPVDNLKRVLTEEFGRFGKIVEFNLVPAKGVAFVTYESRVIAEFVKVAMASQPLGNYSSALNVKWAHDMKKESKKKGHERAAFEARVKQHESQLEVFQEYFLKNNFNTSGPSAAEQAQAERASRERAAERLNKLHAILLDGDKLEEANFDVNI
ncbi:Pre-mRNA-splicing factor CWC2 [Babesia divergens]|uniref:Pre-mRNA-splicing factor CWC2 n=1 Tax=Babesia divergens TaxID=32595 RepID=A0AAD9LEY7_BABDI|nr:Pre-mRNA-splicing factor CWC2 [Babesia divergens]